MNQKLKIAVFFLTLICVHVAFFPMAAYCEDEKITEDFENVENVDYGEAAQIMFVVSTGEAGANHPRWKENMKLAVKLQKKLNDICPGLARPIYVSRYRYNQHVSPGAACC